MRAMTENERERERGSEREREKKKKREREKGPCEPKVESLGAFSGLSMPVYREQQRRPIGGAPPGCLSVLSWQCSQGWKRL